MDLWKAISADEGNPGEVQNEAKGLVKRLSQLEMCILLTVCNTLLEWFQQTSSVLQREGVYLNINTDVSPGIVAKLHPGSLQEIQNF